VVLLLLAYNDARGIRLIQENTSAIYRKKEGEKDTETRRGTEREHEKEGTCTKEQSKESREVKRISAYTSIETYTETQLT